MNQRQVPFQATVVTTMAACVMLMAPSHADAQATCPTANRARAVRLARHAKALMNEQKYEQAMEELRSAYALCPDATLGHAMGCVAEAAGNLAEALASFRACVVEATNDDLRSECRSRVAALESRLKPPAPVATPEAPTPAPQPVAATPAPDSGAPRPVEQPAAVRPPEPVRDVAAPARPSAVWNWVGVGVSVALVGAGVGFLAQYGKDRSEARTSPWVDSSGHTHDPDTVKPTNAIVGGVCAGVGVAALVTSLILWPKAPATVSAGPVSGVGGMVSFGGQW